jgi:hypothetical protein
VVADAGGVAGWQQHQNFWLAWLGWLAGAGAGGVERADLLGLVHLHACAAATLDGNTAALALRTLLPPLHSPLHLLAHGFKQRAGQQAYGGDVGCVWKLTGCG